MACPGLQSPRWRPEPLLGSILPSGPREGTAGPLIVRTHDHVASLRPRTASRELQAGVPV